MVILENPIKEWLKCWRVFKAPRLRWQSYKDNTDKWYYGWLSRRLFGIWSFGLDYKFKYNEPRHECNPRIIIKIFNRIIYIDFVAPVINEDLLYYEGILWYVYKGKNIKQTYFNNIWHSNLDKPTRKITIAPFLRDKYKIECLESDIDNSYKNYVKLSEELKSLKNVDSKVSH